MEISNWKPNRHAVFKTWWNESKKCLQHLGSKPVFCAIEEATVRRCFSKVSLSWSVTPKRLIVFAFKIGEPPIYKGGWRGLTFLDLLTIIDWDLSELSLIPQILHQDSILQRSLFKEFATAILLEGEPIEAYNVSA